MSMQVFYTERIEGSCHRIEFAPQLRGFVAIDRLQLQYSRLGGDVVRNYTEREISEKLWQYLYGDIYRNLEMLLCCGIPCDTQFFLKWHDRLHSLRKLVRSKQEGGQFIRVDDLDMKTLNEEKQKAECQARVWKMAYNGADAQCSEKEKELDHLRILYRNHFKRQRRKTRRNRRRR